MLGYNVALRDAQLDALTRFAGGSCRLRLYDGLRPVTGGTATVLLAELTCSATFAGDANGGVLTLNQIESELTAEDTGTARWFRIVRSDGETLVMDGDVGLSGADLNVNTVDIVAGAVVAVTGFTIVAGNP